MREVSFLRTFALGAAFLAIAVLPAAALAATPEEVSSSAGSAAQWLRSQQKADGQIEGFGGDWSATALAAAGVNSADVRVGPGNPSLQDYLFGEYTSGEWLDPPAFEYPALAATDYERAILASYGAGLDPARLSAASNLPAQLAGIWNSGTGSFGTPSTNGTAFGILALTKTALPGWALKPALSYLRLNQHYDGGWGFPTATTDSAKKLDSEPDMTGAAIAALCEAGVPAYDSQVSAAVAYLRGEMIEETGGIEYFGTPGNADTNAWVISGLNACGIDPQGAGWTSPSPNFKSPFDFVLTQQLTGPGEEGAFPGFLGTADTYATQDVLRAISGAAFTAAPPAREDPSQPQVRLSPSIAAGTPVPHTLAIELGPDNVRICRVVAPVGAPLSVVLAAQETGLPAPCVGSFSYEGGRLASLEGVAPENADESWLLRLDRGAEQAAGGQAVGFGEVISLRRGRTPIDTTGPEGKQGQTGSQGPVGPRGPRGRPGRNAHISCRAKHRHHRSSKVRCTVKHGRAR